MKKNLVLMAVAAFVLAACAKENAYNTTIAPQYTAEGKVVLFATMPQFEDATKAAIAADGTFSWAVGDKIDVVYTKGGSSDQTYTFSCTNASTGAFEYAGEIADGYTVNRAYYPSGYNGTPSDQHFASLEAAAKGFQMEATVDGGKLAFAHENAMFIVTVKNVPLFARTVWINSSSVDITANSGDVEVCMPVIPADAAKLGIGVTDAVWDAASHNDLISKRSEKTAAIEAKNLYNLTDLEIVPEVHFLSAATNWSPVAENIIDPVDNVSTKTRFAVVGGEEYFRFTVKYGSLVVDYGYSGSKDYNNSDPFLAYESDSACIPSSGLYTISFNVLSGAYTVSKTDDVTMRLVGINNEWSLTAATNPTMTNVFGHVWMWKGTSTHNRYKAYVGGETSWTESENTFGAQGEDWWDSNIVRSGENAGMIANDEVVIALDFDFSPWFLTMGSTSGISEVKLRTDINGIAWNETKDIPLTQHATISTLFYLEDFEVSSAGEFKPYDNRGSWWGVPDDAYKNMAKYPKAKLTSGGNNMSLPTGRYNIYVSILNATTITVVKLD